MTLPTPEEFWGELDCAADVPLHISDRLNKAYAAAYALTETQAKRITELEADLSRAKSLNGMHMKRAIDAGGERDAALASLTELRQMITGAATYANWSAVARLAAATPGRGEKLLTDAKRWQAVVKAIADRRFHVSHGQQFEHGIAFSIGGWGGEPKPPGEAVDATLDADGGAS